MSIGLYRAFEPHMIKVLGFILRLPITIAFNRAYIRLMAAWIPRKLSLFEFHPRLMHFNVLIPTKKMHLSMWSAQWPPFCLGPNVWKNTSLYYSNVADMAPASLYQKHYRAEGITLIPAWISNRMPNKVWDEIT